jgi:hypothetical protein
VSSPASTTPSAVPIPCQARHSMNALLPHVQDLETQISTHDLPSTDWQLWCESTLNGAATQELRRTASLADRKATGAFFTTPTLADRAVCALGVPLDHPDVYLDPTCGVGDLLLAIARQLPIHRTVKSTLSAWGKQLAGCDISSVFVRAARARLALLAMYRLGTRERIDSNDLSDLFPSIIATAILAHPALYGPSDRVIMNPPFLPFSVPATCPWSSGSTNSAAFFTEHAIRSATSGTRLVAILPDVIRSGSRYQRWRSMLSTVATIEDVEPYGTFDNNTDIDVFLLSATVHEPAAALSPHWTGTPTSPDTVSRRFDVRVGAVVPHRDPAVGPQHPYVHAGSLSPWSTKYRIPETRRFGGRVFAPPFVAIRRTSSPRDRKRAVATIVHGTHPVAVENHLIVCLPRDSAMQTCHELLTRLRSPETDDWLNHRIRCRHLTVDSIAELPW